MTQREQEILTSFARGMSCAQMAEASGIGPVSVRNAVHAVQNKLEVENTQGFALGDMKRPGG